MVIFNEMLPQKLLLGPFGALSLVVWEQPELESTLNSDVGQVDGGGGAGTLPSAASALDKAPIGL